MFMTHIVSIKRKISTRSAILAVHAQPETQMLSWVPNYWHKYGDCSGSLLLLHYQGNASMGIVKEEHYSVHFYAAQTIWHLLGHVLSVSGGHE